MSNNSRSRAVISRATAVLRWSVAGATAAALVSSAGHAQTTTGTFTAVVRSGLHSFTERHTAFITIAEVGATKAVSNVSVELRDDADRLVAAVNGVLRRAEPVRLRAPVLTGQGFVQLRAIIRIDTFVGSGSVPIATVEDIGPDSFVARIGVCGPLGQAGGGQEMCPGWSLTADVR